MTFKGNYLINSKFVLENKILEQMTKFKRLGCNKSFEVTWIMN